MQPRCSPKRNSGVTLFEVGVVVAVVMLLVVVLLPVLAKSRKPSHVSCVNNLKQICLTYRVWAGDNGDKYPMGVSTASGGSMELVATGNVLATFLVMSNELSTPKVLHCWEDKAHTATSSFAALGNSNISYFTSVNVTNDTNPQAFLTGDDNFAISGVPIKSGLLEFSTNAPIGWMATRHMTYGNIGLADGSVQVVTSVLLRQWLLPQTGVATNRLAIP